MSVSLATIQKCASELHTKYKVGSIEDIVNILSSHFLSSSSTSSKTTTTTGCQVLMKSGERKNQACGASVVPNTTCCKRHSPKEEEKTSKEPKTEKKMKTEQKEEETKKVTKSSAGGKKSVAVVNSKPVLEVIESRRKMFHIMQNAFGNYEHKETGFIFDSNTDEVIGKQDPDGTITPLSVNDIELCKENNWLFKVPLKPISNSTQPIKKPLVTVEDDYDDDEDEDIEDDE